jgi:hypothetical protein
MLWSLYAWYKLYRRLRVKQRLSGQGGGRRISYRKWNFGSAASGIIPTIYDIFIFLIILSRIRGLRGSGFDDRIYWTFIQLVATVHKSLSDTLSSYDWTLHRNYPDFRLNRQNQSQNYFTTGGLPPISSSWCQAP